VREERERKWSDRSLSIPSHQKKHMDCIKKHIKKHTKSEKKRKHMHTLYKHTPHGTSHPRNLTACHIEIPTVAIVTTAYYCCLIVTTTVIL